MRVTFDWSLLFAQCLVQCAMCKHHKAHGFSCCLTGKILLQFCEQALGVSCYQCRDSRCSSCFNSAPYVPLHPSQLTWCESDHFFIHCQLGHTLCFVCWSHCFSFQKQGCLLHRQLSSQHLASGVLEHDSCQCQNKAAAAAAAQATTFATLKPAVHLQISIKLHPPLCLPLASSSICTTLPIFLPPLPPAHITLTKPTF